MSGEGRGQSPSLPGTPGPAGPGGLTGHPSCPQLTNAGDDVVVFYNDKASLAHLLDMMKAARDGVEDHSPLMYHISLVDLLAACAEGKNVYTEIKCTSLLPLEDVVSVVTHEDCITEVWGAWESCGEGGAGEKDWWSQAGAAVSLSWPSKIGRAHV